MGGPDVQVLRQARRRLAPAELEALIADYQAGARVCELANVYGRVSSMRRREWPANRPGAHQVPRRSPTH